MSNMKLLHCKDCHTLTHHSEPDTSHLLHLCLTAFTLGIWSIVWVITHYNNKSQAQCMVCGQIRGVRFEDVRVFVLLIAAIFLAVFLSGCTSNQYRMGLGAHTSGVDRPDVNLKNPIFIAEVKYPITDQLSLVGQHHSALYYQEHRLGYNLAAFMWEF